MQSIRTWLGLDKPEAPGEEPLRETLDALDHLEPALARELRIQRQDLVALRVAHRQHLPGISRDPDAGG